MAFDLGTFTAGIALSASLAAPVQPCAQGEVLYDGECRPQERCVDGCFPQRLMCHSAHVSDGYAQPWAKWLDPDHRVPLFNKRLDRGGLDQEHLAYLPDIGVVVGSELSTWTLLRWDVRLYIDEGADGAPERVYDLDVSMRDAYKLFYEVLPETIVAAQGERDPLGYLYKHLESFDGARRSDAHGEPAAWGALVEEYRALVRSFERQTCGVTRP